MVRVEGGTAAVERDGESYYFVIPLRNVGNGLAVLQAWRFMARRPEIDTPHAEPAEHRPQTRDLYVPAGDTGFWQGAIREHDDPFREGLRETFLAGDVLTVDLLYGDHEGGQLTISRFVLTREEDGPAPRRGPPLAAGRRRSPWARGTPNQTERHSLRATRASECSGPAKTLSVQSLALRPARLPGRLAHARRAGRSGRRTANGAAGGK